jgi:hypothetical protein
MGWGDEIMAAGQARRLQESDPQGRRVAVYGKNGQPRSSEMWDNNPRILQSTEALCHRDHIRLVNGPGCRPYVDYVQMKQDFAIVFPGQHFNPKIRHPRLPWRYTTWRCEAGELFTPRSDLHGYVVIEPEIKSNASPNKSWGWKRYQRLVKLLPGIDWVQLGPPGTRVLDGVRHISTSSFKKACTPLSGARAAVLPEGGLHHAAAALGIPAVVIFGGMTSPANTGYDNHINIFDDGMGSPCGMRVRCEHCARAMASITPDSVAVYLETLL